MFPTRHWQQHLRRTVLSPPSTFLEIPSVTRVPRPGCFQSANTCALACAVSPQALATALEKNSTITTIDLQGNSIGVEGAKARLLPECKHLCIGMCCFRPRHWQQHLRRTVLSPPSTLGEIPSVWRVPRPGCFQSANTCALACAVLPQALATALEKNSTITTINLLRNSIRDEGAKARVLPECKHLCIGMCCFTPGTGNST